MSVGTEITVPRQERRSFVGRLEIAWDERILEPRPWTAAQSRWAARLLCELPPGPVLELCCGAGHIGLLAVAGSRRELVCVDADPTATSYAASNAERNGLGAQVTTRTATIADLAVSDERYALVIADPPWVSSAETGTFPADPLLAIDGGPDGTDVAVECVATAARLLVPGGVLVLQVGSEAQLDGPITAAAHAHRMLVAERRVHERGTLALLVPWE